MNLFKIMQSIRGWAQAGKIDFPGAVKYLTDLGVKMDGIVHQALKNVFKEGKARDPDFGNVVQRFPIDDAGIPFNPNTLKSTVEKRGVENLFKETKVPKEVKFGKPNYELIAEREGIDVELIKGKSVKEIIEYLAMLEKADGGRIGFESGGSSTLDRLALKMHGKLFDKLNDEQQQEIHELLLEGYAQGGRVGFIEGGWADDLTGQGLAVYNSMKSAQHTDQTIQDTLKSLGYWGGDATGIETITATAPNIGGGGGEARENTGFGKWGNLDKSTKKTVYRDIWSDELQTAIPQPIDIYQDTGNIWKTWEGGGPYHLGLDKVKPLIGQVMSDFLGIEDEGYGEGDIMGTYSDWLRPWAPNYKDLNFIQKWKADSQRNKKLRDMQKDVDIRNAAIAEQAAAAKAQVAKTAAGIGPTTGQGQAIDPGHLRDISKTGFHEYKDSGTAASYEGSFKDGGLATMFTRRR